jgi:hypothetical protein
MEHNEKALTISKKGKKFQRSVIIYKINVESPVCTDQNND